MSREVNREIVAYMDLVLTACYMSKIGSLLGSFIIRSLPLHLDHDSGPGRAACLLFTAP